MRCVANDFIVNVRKEPTAVIRKYEQDIAELQQELAMHDSLTERHQISYGPYTDAQKAEVAAQVQAFLQSQEAPDSIAPLQLLSLRHMKEVLCAAKVGLHPPISNCLCMCPTSVQVSRFNKPFMQLSIHCVIPLFPLPCIHPRLHFYKHAFTFAEALTKQVFAWHLEHSAKNSMLHADSTQWLSCISTFQMLMVLLSRPTNAAIWASADKTETRFCLPCSLSTSKHWHRSPAWERLALCLRQLQQRNKLQLLLAWHQMSINRYTSLAVISAQASWASRQALYDT